MNYRRLYLIKVAHWTPTLCYEASLCHVEVEHVDGVVDGFDSRRLTQP
jgi:hypothetical protein